jgi:methionine sulfoxide reductase heme-binding subunit
MQSLFQRYTPLQIITHLGAWFPLARLLFDLALGNLSANPVQDMQQRTGRAAITLLTLTLACTPLHSIFGWREPLKRQRALGLYAFMYVTIHLTIFINLEYGFAWSLLLQTIFEKPYILIGLLAFLLLIPLAMTSFDVWKARMGKNWKRLHRFIYIIAPLAALHYAWAKKGDLFFLRGDIRQPLIYAGIITILLILRIPTVRKFLASARGRILVPFRRTPSAPPPRVQE